MIVLGSAEIGEGFFSVHCVIVRSQDPESSSESESESGSSLSYSEPEQES